MGNAGFESDGYLRWHLGKAGQLACSQEGEEVREIQY